MGYSSWQKNYGGNCYTIICLVWSIKSFNLSELRLLENMAASVSTQPQFMTSMGNGDSSSNAPLIENTDSNQIVVPDPHGFFSCSPAVIWFLGAAKVFWNTL